jgi:hypothetical protein
MSSEQQQPTDASAAGEGAAADGSAGGNAAPEPAAIPTPEPGHAPARRMVTVRRAPRFVPIMVAGAVLGFLAAVVIAYTGPEDPTLTRGSVLGFFTMLLALPGLLLGGLAALVLDRISVRRASRAVAEPLDDDGA